MNTVTMTELRRKPKKLIEAIERGKEVTILYRSRVLGVAKPMPKPKEPLTRKDFAEISEILKKITPKELVPLDKREETYRKRLEKEYGPRIPRHKYNNRYL